MLDPKFIKGEKITSKDDTGRVNFIDKKYITKNLDNLVKDTDLSKFIL